MSIRGRKRRGRSTGQTQEIAVDWRRLADGQARRVARGVDFSGSAASFREAATKAAAGMGKRVLLTRDRVEARKYVWIQFADAEIVEGSRCVCGGARIRRIGLGLGQCRECGARLILKERREEKPIEARIAGEAEPAHVEPRGASLDDLSDVRLVRFGESRGDHDYVGLAVDPDGRTVLLVVRVPLQAGAPISLPDSPLGVVHEVLFLKQAPTVHLHDSAEPGDEESEWDIVLL